MNKYKNEAYPLRISEELMQKLEELAIIDNRTRNKEIEYILQKYVNDYETNNGQLKINMVKNDGTINTLNM